MIGPRWAWGALLALGAAAAGCAAHVAPMTQAGHGYAEPEDEAWLKAKPNLFNGESAENEEGLPQAES